LSLVAARLASLAAFFPEWLTVFKHFRENRRTDRLANHISHRVEVAVAERVSSLLATRLASFASGLPWRLPLFGHRLTNLLASLGLLATHATRPNDCQNDQKKQNTSHGYLL
jgi:hypothetical protein